MTDLASFETTLKEVVEAKRLSASKMGRLTDNAMKCMEDDTQLVSILYRTHKSLPATAKVSSLYVFDALSRAARTQVTKHGLTGDINSEKGNAATFLLKVEGVLEGLFQDMMSSSNSENKEKTKKILDIWIKGSTFPSAILARLKEISKDPEKEIGTNVPAHPDPRASTVTIPTTAETGQQPIVSPADPVQTTLLALLSQAAAAAATSNGQTATNTVPAGLSQADAAQFLLLQQLSQSPQLINGRQQSGQTIPLPLSSLVPSSVPGQTITPVAGPSQYQDARHDSTQEESSYGKYEGQGRGGSREEFRNDRPLRDGHREGYRGRGRGDGRGRRDDRGRYRERDWSPPSRGRHSRSQSPRSPRRYGGRRDIKPYSPPRRPSIVASEQSHSAQSITSAPEVEKDEFGRDLRPLADSTPTNIQTQPPEAEATPVENPEVDANMQLDTHAPPPKVSNLGLDQFDIEAVDLTSPATWETLGNMWHLSYGYQPSPEEIMQFVFAKRILAGGGITGQSGVDHSWGNSGWSGAHRGGTQTWRGRGWSGQSRGRGGHSYSQEQWNQIPTGYTSTSDAVVLNSSPDDTGNQVSSETSQLGASSPEAGQNRATGKMQRVGDRWIFVREPSGGAS